MERPGTRLFALRPQLARRLGLIAAGGLAAVLLTGLLALAGAVKALGHSWSSVLEGSPLLAAGFSISAVCLTIVAARLLAVLCLAAPEASGVRVTRDVVPDFYKLLDGIARRMGACRVDQVWVTGDMNAMVMQRPRWGCVGRIETHLVIGLPLVHSVSRSQLAAVLAHEFAHLAVQRKGVGKLGAHLRAWWLRVLDALCEILPALEGLANRGLRRFYRDMLRLSRIEEFEADAIAAHYVGAGLLGETLVEVSLKERFLRQDYWPKVMAQSAVRARPSIRPYREMGLGVEAGFLRPASVRDATELLLEDDGDVDELPLHPSLLERLRALQVPLRAASADRPSAAAHYFAPILPTLAWVFDRAWWQDIRPGWRETYRNMRRRWRD